MANFHLYVQTQKHPAMNVGDFQQLRVAMLGKGQENGGDNPNRVNHWRQKVGPGEAEVSFEAVYDELNIADAWFVTWLANDLSVPETEIGTTETFTIYGRDAKFDHLGSDRFTVTTFGQTGAPLPFYETSRQANAQFIGDNPLDWETP